MLCALPVTVTPTLTIAQNLPSLGDSDREELSPLMERKLGEQIMRDMRRDRDYLDDAPLLEYLNNLGGTLVAARPEARGEAGYDFFFFAVRDPVLNAFALPGGFIAVHSGLMLAAQSESELASVMGHEIGHVAQRHIARMLGKQRQDSLIPLAGLVLAVLAARSNPDASSALLLSGEGVALQRQLNFSRDAEREADRVGLQILQEAGYDTSGMISFFERMQSTTRSYSDAAPAFLRSHPMTTERIADIQARTRNNRYKQHADSLDFSLIKARVRVLQDDSMQGMREAETVFNNQLQQNDQRQIASAKYGLAFIAFKRGRNEKAKALLQEARSAVPKASLPNVILSSLSIDIKLAANQSEEALKEADAARAQFPLSRGIAGQYADALIAARHYEDAMRYLRDQTQLYRQEPRLQESLARAYSALGKQALQHMALAESYALSGGLPAALDQLALARKAPDASFYDLAVIDARDRELKAQWKEEMKEKKK
ncbi:MAG: beta-barrel assembly-enhancing protease [Burkholderiaceae bacterium]